MSHVTDVRLTITDDEEHLEALAEACDNLGLEFQKGKRTFAWWGRYEGDSHQYGDMRPEEMGHCLHAIKIKGDQPQTNSGGPWEIGLAAKKDGSGLGVYFDQFGHAGGRLLEKVGPNANRLRQEYATCVAERSIKKTLARHGWRAVRETLPNGAIRIKVRGR